MANKNRKRVRWKLPKTVALLILTVPAFLGIGVLLAAPDQGEIVEKAQAQREQALPRSTEPGSAEDLPEVEKDPGADQSPLGVDLKVIRLIAHQDRADLEARFDITAPVMVDGNLQLPAGLTAELETTYVGQPISQALLDGVVKDIINAYRQSDYPLVDVYLPEQNITGGKLQVVVREAVLGEVSVDGAVHSNSAYLMKQIRVSPGQRINSRILEADIDWINTNPSRRVDLIYERGETEGTSDIVLQTEEFAMFTAYLGFGNTGVEATGMNEWSAGFNWANILGSEHSFGYNYGADYDFNNLDAHLFIYELPFPWRHRLQLVGAYVTSESQSGPGLDVDGESVQISADYKIFLPRLQGKHRQNLVFGIDYKSTNTDILFGGSTLSATTAEVFQFRTGYDVTVADQHGYTRFDAGAVWSPGDITGRNTDADFDALRSGSEASYWYLTGGIERYVKLPAEWSLVARLSGQVTGDRLISTEQLLAGGYRSVRGVDENLARGDSGWLGSLELHAPPFSLFEKPASPPAGDPDPKNPVTSSPVVWDRINLYGFYDVAHLYSEGSLAAEPDQSLHTAGFGMNCRLGENASLRASYGWLLDSSGIDDPGNGKVHFGFTLSY